MNKKSLWDYIVSKNHIIPSPLGNKLGIPVLRTVLADLIIKLRRFKNCRPKNDYEKKLIKDGIVVIPNFLPEEEFQKLKKEFDTLTLGSTKDSVITKNGSSEINTYPINKEEYENFPAIKTFANNKQLIRLIAVAEGKHVFKEIDSLRLEKSIFGDPKKDTDANIEFHADVHFHSHKVLFYMDNVSENEGPFNYCLESHRNNFSRLWFELKRGQLKDAYKSGWRIQNHLDKKFFKNFFQKLMDKNYKVTNKPNTLIIANVHGFHKRGEAVNGTQRSIIRVPYRYNPLGPSTKLSEDLYSGSLF